MTRREPLAFPAAAMTIPGAERRPRARDIGLEPVVFQPGPLDASADVAGVRSGQCV